MRILHISPYVPSIKAGHAGGVCMGKEVETLSKNHDVFLLSFINDEKEKELAKMYEGRSKFIISNKFTKAISVVLHPWKPNLFAARSSMLFRINLIKIVKKHRIECIHAEYTSMGQFWWIKKLFPYIKFNLVEHDVTAQSYTRMRNTSKGYMRLYYNFQLNRVVNCERKYCQKADLVFTLNGKDKELMSEYYKLKTPMEVITPYYGIDEFGANYSAKEENSICFIGHMGREENHVAAMRLIRIFQEIDSLNYKLYIIGAHPSPELQGQQKDNIIITGFVDDINACIDQCEIAVFPLETGAGIKLKVLLAFGRGLPVITTDVGAEGIDAQGEVLLLAKDDSEIKKYINKLLTNREYLLEKSKESVNFVIENFGWEKTEELFTRIYEEK